MKDKFQGRSEGLGVDEMWEEMKQAVVQAAEVTIRRTKPGRRPQREEWWWSEEVRQALKEKKRTFKRWRKSGLEADREEYNAKKDAKKAVAVTKKEGTVTLYEELDAREGEIKIYRIAEARQREREGTGNVNIIKNSEGKVVFKQEVGEVRAEYFEELLHVENERGQLQVVDPVENPVLEITKEEVERAVRKMKSNKASGSSIKRRVLGQVALNDPPQGRIKEIPNIALKENFFALNDPALRTA